MPDTSSLSRRRFLKTAAATGALAAVPYFVPATVLGKNGAVPPSEKIMVGGIGIGGRGIARPELDASANKDVQFVAICDVQKTQREAVKELVDEHVRQQGLRHVPRTSASSWPSGRTSTRC